MRTAQLTSARNCRGSVATQKQRRGNYISCLSAWSRTNLKQNKDKNKTIKWNSHKACELRRDFKKVIQLVQAEKSTRYNSLRRIRTKHRCLDRMRRRLKVQQILITAAGRSGLPRIVDCANKASSKVGPPPNVLTTRWLNATHMKKYWLLAEQRSTKEQVWINWTKNIKSCRAGRSSTQHGDKTRIHYCKYLLVTVEKLENKALVCICRTDIEFNCPN